MRKAIELKHAVAWVAALCGAAGTLFAQTPELLPGTARWEFPPDIVAEQYRELRDFYERQHRDAASERERFGHSPVDEQRRALAELAGVRDEPIPPAPQGTALGETAE